MQIKSAPRLITVWGTDQRRIQRRGGDKHTIPAPARQYGLEAVAGGDVVENSDELHETPY